MNKTELRSVLSRTYGVTLTPQEFKESSVAVLEAMLENAQLEVATKLEANNKEIKLEGDVNMNKPVSTTISFEDLLSNIQEDQRIAKYVGRQVKVSEAKVKNHVTDTSRIVVQELSKKIDALEGTIKALVTAGAQTVKYTEVTNPAQTNTQYNKAAAKLQPMGYVVNDKTGIKEAYFGVCSVCGCKIKSAKVVEYSKSRFGKVMCYAHQNNNSNNNAGTQQQPKSQTVTHKCMYCGKDVTFKDQATLDSIMAKAKARGLAPIAHPGCYKAAMNTQENIEQVMQQQSQTQSNISEEAKNVISDIFNQAPVQDETLVDPNATWTSVPVDETNDTNNDGEYVQQF